MREREIFIEVLERRHPSARTALLDQACPGRELFTLSDPNSARILTSSMRQAVVFRFLCANWRESSH